MERVFKILFGIAVFVFCLSVVGVFLLIIKIILISQLQVSFLGITFSKSLF